MNLRRTTTAAALLATALATVAAPGWSETLRLEGYYDYVDLQLGLQLPTVVVAGEPTPFGLFAENAGPGTADYPVLLLSGGNNMQIEGVSGCASLEFPQRTCALAPLAAHWAHVPRFRFHLEPFSRGIVVFGAALTSEAVDTNPGNELQVVSIPIVAEAETRVAFVDVVPETLGDGRLAWTVRVDNDGPSAAISPFVYNASWAYGGFVEVQCASDGTASCPEQMNYLGPGSGWNIRLVAPPLSAENPEIQVGYGVQPQEAGNAFGNDGVWLVYRDAFFSDGFE